MRPSHDRYFLDMLKLVAARSTCHRRNVGAIIITQDHTILSTGYNGVPRGFKHCEGIYKCPGWDDEAGDTTRCEAVHAEMNAVLQCPRIDLAHTIYVSCLPCFQCAKVLANTPLKRIICSGPYADNEGRQIFKRANIELLFSSQVS